MRPLLVGGEDVAERPGGLNRYVADLAVALGGECDVVEVSGGGGPGAVAPAPLPARLWRTRAATDGLAGAGSVLDVHFALYGAAALASRRVRALPAVAHFHGPWAQESRAEGEGGAAVWAKRRVERAVYGRAQAVVCLSHAFARVAVEHAGVSPWRLRVVPPAVDLERFAPGDRAAARAALGLDPDGLVVVAARRLVARTGVDRLLRAWSQRADGTLLIAGEGPQREALERDAEALGLGERVRFAGRVSDSELVDAYRAADLCVLPSRSFEGFGLAVLEALACGTPVAAAAVGGLPEALAGLDRRLVLPASDAEFGPALNDLLDDRAALPTSPSCRAHAERYSPAALAEAHRALYAAAARPGTVPDARRRIVYLDHTAALSGGELALTNLIAASPTVQPHVILGEDGPLVAHLHARGISVEVRPLPAGIGSTRRAELGRASALRPRAALALAGHVLGLARRLRALDPDAVHTNSLKAGAYGALAARIARVPVVWHLHDRLAADYLPRPVVRVMRAAVRWLPDVLVANSEATLATVPKAPRMGARVVSNPVAATGTDHPVADRVRRVGMVARLAPWKGQAEFLRAFAHAFADDPEAEAVLVGAALFGEEAYERELHALAAELGIAQRVDFRGFRADPAAEMGRLDVLVHASLTPEPFGQTIVEAMAAGVPVVAARGGGASEIVTEGSDGLLHEPGSTSDLTRALSELAGDRALRERLSRAGLRRAGDFSPERCGAQLEAAYALLLD